MHHNSLPPFQPLTSPFVPSQQQGATTSGQPAMTFHGLSPTPGSHQAAPSSSTWTLSLTVILAQVSPLNHSNLCQALFNSCPLERSFTPASGANTSQSTLPAQPQAFTALVQSQFGNGSVLTSTNTATNIQSFHSDSDPTTTTTSTTDSSPAPTQPPQLSNPKLSHPSSMAWIFTLCLKSFRWTSLLLKPMIVSQLSLNHFVKCIPNTWKIIWLGRSSLLNMLSIICHMMLVHCSAQYLESNSQLCPAVTPARPISPYVVPSSTTSTINTSFTFFFPLYLR